MFESFAALMPLLEKKLKLKKTEISTADEFRAALQKLNENAGASAQRLFVEAEYQGRPVVAILVLK